MEQDTQKLKLTEEQISLFRTIAKGAEPYPDNEPLLEYFDAPLDNKRVAATRARHILLEYGISIEE